MSSHRVWLKSSFLGSLVRLVSCVASPNGTCADVFVLREVQIALSSVDNAKITFRTPSAGRADLMLTRKVLSDRSTLHKGSRGAVVVTRLAPGHILLTLYGYNDGEIAAPYYAAMEAEMDA